MDKIHIFIKGFIEGMECVDLDGLIDGYREMVGFDWIEAMENDWDIRDVQFPELDIRSALEFIRPELTERQLAVVDEIDSLYKEWIAEDIF